MQIAGEKTEALAGFNGRAGQDYAVYLLGSERRDRGSNGKIGLAVPAGPMPRVIVLFAIASQ